MADRSSQGDSKSEAQFAKRLDPTKEGLSKEQLQFIRQVELAQWKKKTVKLRGRNVATGLAIGAVVLGIYGYTFYSVSQEKIMDEIDEEARTAKIHAPKTGAN
ncbi:cytochrome c oxidase assembly factor 3 homolog, mitochondrial-like [Myxocyprinus asiaticus]|uniref:cytochrome c oxidase assembly factor 3 homolog, mitochondrial-like n=1 Tax=Myxocyprinus asiaticus TaxID=70543 RepID=UPI0022213B2A|nr:cytochrome c oxidase assembly factor 3 homolog, mitochondrial-like [Myxocyprinus asiaticus]